MDESESKKENRNGQEYRFDPELLKEGLHCDLDQYEMLKRCSDKKDITEWNNWREEYRTVEILLEGAYLVGANLQKADLGGANLQKAYLMEVNLLKAMLVAANLQEARLGEANLQEANLAGANLRKADLREANLQKANLREANLQEAELWAANLQKAELWAANLQKADLWEANLQKANLEEANLQGANFKLAIVDGSTLITPKAFDRSTNFTGVGLDSARVDPGTKQLLEYNIRRLRWKDWYKEHPKLKWIVKPFWWMSDYGLSTGRIIAVFFGLAVIFQNIYYHWGRIAPPGIVDNLFIDRNGVVVASWLVPLRTLYFSIVTMTTLGFGDMYANAHSIWGHILLSIQVILGYVLLGALVTRFAVLFTAGGPAGRFEDEKKKKDKTKQEAE